MLYSRSKNCASADIWHRILQQLLHQTENLNENNIRNADLQAFQNAHLKRDSSGLLDDATADQIAASKIVSLHSGKDSSFDPDAK